MYSLYLEPFISSVCVAINCEDVEIPLPDPWNLLDGNTQTKILIQTILERFCISE